MATLHLLLFLFFLQLITILCKHITPKIVNDTGEYYYFNVRPDISSIRNITCNNNKEQCNIFCNQQESCQKFVINTSISSHIYLECNYPFIKELRPGSCWRLSLFTNINYAQYPNINIYCSNENCAQTCFHLNYSNHSYILFNGNWAGKNSKIYALNIPHNLDILCNHPESCSMINIYCPITSKCNINCAANKSCEFGDIYVNNLNLLNLNCNYSSTSCRNLNIYCNNNTRNKLLYDFIDKIWKCESETCCPFKFKQNYIKCSELHSNCIINCSKSNGCNWGTIDAMHDNINSLELICDKPHQCKLANVYCPNENSKCDIKCNKKESCANINVYNYKTVNELNILCAERSSCQNMKINMNVNGNITIKCNNDWSCSNAVFNLTSTDNDNDNDNGVFSIYCAGRYSCEGIQVYCPYKSINSCLIECSDSDSSCGGMKVIAPKFYEYNYLQINCPDPSSKESKAMLKPCNYIKHTCFDKKSTVLRYTSNNNNICSNDVCCPWEWVINVTNTDDIDNKDLFDIVIAILCCLTALYCLPVMCSYIGKI